MNFTEFQHFARLYVIGALEEEEMTHFEAGRAQFGPAADAYVAECRRLESAFALSLSPLPPRRGARQRLLRMIGERRGRAAAKANLRPRVGQDRPLHGAAESDLSE